MAKLPFFLSRFLFSAAAVILIIGQARAEQPWQVSSYQERVYSAFLRNESLSRIVVECRVPRFSEPEVTITLTLREQSNFQPTTDFVATVALGNKLFKIPMTRMGDPTQEVEYRWTAMGAASFSSFNDAAEAISLGHSLTVGDSDGGATEEFSYDMASAYGLTGVIRRCSPASVHAREEVENLMDTRNLLVLQASANDKCRGGAGNLASTWAACDERTEYSERLYALGMCYGEKGQIGARMRWHRCGPNSIR